MILSTMIMFAIVSLVELNQIYDDIITFYLLLSVYYLGITNTMPPILYIIITLMFINHHLKII